MTQFRGRSRPLRARAWADPRGYRVRESAASPKGCFVINDPSHRTEVGFGLDTKDTAMSLFVLLLSEQEQKLKLGKALPLSLFSFSHLPPPSPLSEGRLAGHPGFGRTTHLVSLCWLCKDSDTV